MAISFKCFNCDELLSFVSSVGRRDECPRCHADVHCCRNCSHFDPKSYNECREPSADVQREKDRSNFCDFFLGGGAGRANDKAAELKSMAEALFKKKN